MGSQPLLSVTQMHTAEEAVFKRGGECYALMKHAGEAVRQQGAGLIADDIAGGLPLALQALKEESDAFAVHPVTT